MQISIAFEQNDFQANFMPVCYIVERGKWSISSILLSFNNYIQCVAV